MRRNSECISVQVPTGMPVHQVRDFVKMVEELGFESIGLGENFPHLGGIAATTMALADTKSLNVRLGVLPAPVRHPIVTAMEFSSLAITYPGRFTPGLGLGAANWLKRLKLMPDHPASYFREYVRVVSQLMAGETVVVNDDNSPYLLNSLQLQDTPDTRPPLALGGMGKFMLTVCGSYADVVVLSISSPEYVRWACKVVSEAADAAGRSRPRLVAGVPISIHADPMEALNLIRPWIVYAIANFGPSPLTAPLGINDELTRLKELESDQQMKEFPDSWIHSMCIAGDRTHFHKRLEDYFDAGADEVNVLPVPFARTEDVLRQVATVVNY